MMTLNELFKKVPGEIDHIASHTSSVRAGSCFVALRGLRIDGHDCVEQAVAKGARVVVVERRVDLPETIAQVIVPDTRKVLALLAARQAGDPSQHLRLIGITGTNGKTTISYLLESIYKAAGLQPGVIGTLGYRFAGETGRLAHTTPPPLELQQLFQAMVQRDIRACAMEVSSHAIAQERVAGCHFDGAIFTNLTSEHLDYHENMETYFQAKARLFTELLQESQKEKPFVVINADDSYGERLAVMSQFPIWRYGFSEQFEVSCRRYERKGEGMQLDVITPGGALQLYSKLIGRFNAGNIMASVATGCALQFPMEAIQEGIERVEHIPGRFETVQNRRGFRAIVDYAHTPDALNNLLVQAREITAGRVITVFGCGGDRDRSKRPLMGKIATELSDIVVVTSDNPRSEEPQTIIDDILKGVTADRARVCTAILDRRAAIVHAVSAARPGDAVVVAGKGHEDYQIIGERRLPFDDREELRRCCEGKERGASCSL